MIRTSSPLDRAQRFCAAFDLRIPVLMAPMAGACPPALAAAVANAGGMGACGALPMKPAAVAEWAAAVRARSDGPFQMNLWIPDPAPARDAGREAAVRELLGRWGPAVAPRAGDAAVEDFDAQCEALLAAGPAAMSSIMGLYPEPVVAGMKARGIRWFATVTTVAEARAAVDAGADVVVAQGYEAGGHRGTFEAQRAAASAVGLLSLLPAVVDAVDVPVVATGGIADPRTAAAAMVLGASAVQIGTGLLRSPEADLAPAWAAAIGAAAPEDTALTRAFSGRLGRSVRTAYVAAADAPGAPEPAPSPVQRGLTAAMRAQGTRDDDIDRIQAWAGQSAALAPARPAGEIVTGVWEGAKALLR